MGGPRPPRGLQGHRARRLPARHPAKDCNQNDYKKLVEALAREHNVDIVEVPKNTQLGEWCGLCKIGAEGNPRKVVKCSMAVVKDYGEDSEGLNILMEHLKANKYNAQARLPRAGAPSLFGT